MRFSEAPDQLAASFGQSVDVDAEIALDDIAGSIAWARELARAGLLTDGELSLLADGLEGLRVDLEAGRLELDPLLEDVHMNIESLLEERVGPVAGKLHAGRSRNDQVSTDLRMWLRRTIDGLDERLVDLEQALVVLAQRHAYAVMPGHTHLQPAQPVLFAHHLLAHVEMLERDRGRLADTRRRANVSPLGSGAIAGSGFRLDRERIAAELGFDGVTGNSIDASGDRDFVIEALAAMAMTMVHLSRLAEEVAWWSNPRMGFVRPSDAFSSGSSMMPNKRNPDPAELVRGRAAVVIGQLSGALALVKGLPLGYQRDLQETKRPLVEAAQTLASSLGVLAGLVSTLHVDEARMAQAANEGFTTATSLADTLVLEGVPFRTAHHAVGSLVRRAEAHGTTLADVSAEDIRQTLADSSDARARALADEPEVVDRLRQAASVRAALERCDVIGGTAPRRVATALDLAAERLGVD